MSAEFSIDPHVSIPSVVPSGTTTTQPQDRPPYEILDVWDPAGHDGPSIDVDAAAWRHEGHAPVAELALTARAVRALGGRARVLMAVSTRFVADCAKLRALRRMCPDVHVTAIGDPRDLSTHDTDTNRIRITLQAAASVWGGADAVCVLPHSFLSPESIDEDAIRHARGVLHLLRHESHADFPLDPAAGSGTMETATDALVKAARALVAALDADPDGGVRRLDQLRNDGRAWHDGPRYMRDTERILVGDTHYTGGEA